MGAFTVIESKQRWQLDKLRSIFGSRNQHSSDTIGVICTGCTRLRIMDIYSKLCKNSTIIVLNHLSQNSFWQSPNHAALGAALIWILCHNTILFLDLSNLIFLELKHHWPLNLDFSLEIKNHKSIQNLASLQPKVEK